MAFNGWPAEALEFYEGLEADNSKAYWLAHKTSYEESIKAPFIELSELVEKEFGPLHLFRPYRDTRFSKDKTPYKTHIGATLGETSYVHFSADGLGAGAGRWQLGPERLARYRAAVAGFSSTFIFTKVILSPCWPAISSRMGETWRHGPHHSAQKSTRTGLSDLRTCASNSASVTALMLPTGCFPSLVNTEV